MPNQPKTNVASLAQNKVRTPHQYKPMSPNRIKYKPELGNNPPQSYIPDGKN